MKRPALETLENRRYRAGDLESVRRLHEAAPRAADSFAEGHEADLDADLDDIDDVYLKDGGFLVGVLGGRIVAMAALTRTSLERAEVKRMRVEPAVQGRGLVGPIESVFHEKNLA